MPKLGFGNPGLIEPYRKGNYMGRIPNELRVIIAANIKQCRITKYGGRGGGKKCAEDFGVSPQQWSPWENGKRTPDEERLTKIAEFFGVSVEYLRRDNAPGQNLISGRAHDAQTDPNADRQTECAGEMGDEFARKRYQDFFDTALLLPKAKMVLTVEMDNTAQ